MEPLKLCCVNSRSQEVWGLRYIDDAMGRLLDKNLDGDCRDSGELFWQLSDAQFSSVAVVDKNAVLQERVSYTSYGVGTHRWPHEVNNSGGVTTSGTTSDYGVIDGLAGAHSGAGTPIDNTNYNVAADLNRDGIIDSTDTSIFTSMGGAKSALASGLISDPSGPDNPFGYDGYVYNPDQGLYTVRFRWYNASFGRWLQRDPVGYADSMALYEYVIGTPVGSVDPSGLLSQSHDDGCSTNCSLSPDCEETKRLFDKLGNINRALISACGEDDPDVRAIRAGASAFAQALGQFGGDVLKEFLVSLGDDFHDLGVIMLKSSGDKAVLAAAKQAMTKGGVSRVLGKCAGAIGPVMDAKKILDGAKDGDVLIIISGASGIVLGVLPGGKFVQLGAGLIEAGIEAKIARDQAAAQNRQNKERCQFTKNALAVYEKRFEDALEKCGSLPVKQMNMRSAQK